MKRLILYLTFNLCIILGVGQGVIIDHNCVDVSQIPSNIIEDIKDGINFQWCGQSHSGQVPCGLEVLESIYSQFDVTIAEMVLPTTPNSMSVYVGNQGFNAPGQCCTSITPEGYWIAPTGPEWTNACLAYNPTLNVSGFLWCWQLEANGAAYVQSYLNQMEAFEQQHPNVTFVYTTANAQAYGDAGLTRHTNNEMIRAYCIAHNKVLFDFGDIDCWYNGVQNTTTYNGVTYPVQHTAFDGQECGHVNLLGAEYKARAIWWMMARIRGWNPSLANNPPVIVDQSFNINLYPNPSNNFINIEIENLIQDLASIDIIDMNGEVALVEEFRAWDSLLKKQININHLNSGFYIVKVKASETVIFKKFIKL
jgi:hypothetical protein